MNTACIVERRVIEWPDPEKRFSGNGHCKYLPLSMASPPPPDPAPATKKLYGRVTPLPNFKAKPKPKDTRAKNSATGNRGGGRRKATQSELADSPCPKDGGAHDWSPYDKKRTRCYKCRCRVLKSLVRNLVLVRRSRVGVTEFINPCTDPGGHNVIGDGRGRVLCKNCKHSRLATPAELAQIAASRKNKGKANSHAK